MNGLYIIGVDILKYPEYRGVRKKIQGQLEAYRQLNIKMDYIDLYNDTVFFNDKETNYRLEKKNSFMKYNEFYIKLFKKKIIDPNKYDFVYIRFSMANIGCYILVKYLHKLGVKVIIEIPTYPYIQEITPNIKNNIRIGIDNFIWKRYKKYIYRLAVTNDLESIHGIKVISIFNGVDLNDISISESEYRGDTINIIGVANISKWHGYDRVILGIFNFYKKAANNIDVNFYIVGEGEEKENLMNLVSELDIEDHVIFTGLKYGEELDEIYNKANIGVSSLALYRAGGGHDPIKSKECIAKGLPVIISKSDRAFDEGLDFVFKIEDNDSAVDIDYILECYKRLNTTSTDIRKYAERNLSWKSQIKKIVDAINES